MITPDYSDDEVSHLQSVIASLSTLSEEDMREAGGAVEDGRCPLHLAPFWSLIAPESRDGLDPQLFRKLSADPFAAEYSYFAFFPLIYPRLYHHGERPQIRFDGRTRGRVALFRFDDGDGLVVKPLQSRREAEVAALAGQAEIGPRQLPSLEGFLVEELVDGRFFTDFAPEEMTDDLIYQVGFRLGAMLASLHAAGIYYNDATLSDPDGRSHLLVQSFPSSETEAAPECRLIDFGVSVLLDKFPDLEMEEVFNLVRTTPEFRLLSRMGLRGREMGNFLAQYRRRLAATPKEEILARDLRFTEEGLQQAARKMGSGIIAPFRQGFSEGYGQ